MQRPGLVLNVPFTSLPRVAQLFNRVMENAMHLQGDSHLTNLNHGLLRSPPQMSPLETGPPTPFYLLIYFNTQDICF